MSDTAYQIDFSGSLVTSKLQHILILRDHLAETNPDLHALITGGGYFSLLAERLTEISHDLGRNNQSQTVRLQRIINDLLFVQSKYDLRAKREKRKKA